jgi:hypothetical protein
VVSQAPERSKKNGSTRRCLFSNGIPKLAYTLQRCNVQSSRTKAFYLPCFLIESGPAYTKRGGGWKGTFVPLFADKSFLLKAVWESFRFYRGGIEKVGISDNETTEDNQDTSCGGIENFFLVEFTFVHKDNS